MKPLPHRTQDSSTLEPRAPGRGLGWSLRPWWGLKRNAAGRVAAPQAGTPQGDHGDIREDADPLGAAHHQFLQRLRESGL